MEQSPPHYQSQPNKKELSKSDSPNARPYENDFYHSFYLKLCLLIFSKNKKCRHIKVLKAMRKPTRYNEIALLLGKGSLCQHEAGAGVTEEIFALQLALCHPVGRAEAGQLLLDHAACNQQAPTEKAHDDDVDDHPSVGLIALEREVVAGFYHSFYLKLCLLIFSKNKKCRHIKVLSIPENDDNKTYCPPRE
ncbi:hypothetical protein [Limosilactobacillus fermentum]